MPCVRRSMRARGSEGVRARTRTAYPHPRSRVHARRASGQQALRENDTRRRACVQPRTPAPRASMPIPPAVLTFKIEHSQGHVGLERRRQRFSALVADALPCHITRPTLGPGHATPALTLAPAALCTQACAHPSLPHPPCDTCACLVSAGPCVSGHARLHPHPRPRVHARRASGQQALREGDTRPRPCLQPRTPAPRASMPMTPGVLTPKIEHSQGRVGLERRRQRFSALVADVVPCHITRPPSGPGPPPPALSLAPAALCTQACAHPALPPPTCHMCIPCVRRCMRERG